MYIILSQSSKKYQRMLNLNRLNALIFYKLTKQNENKNNINDSNNCKLYNLFYLCSIMERAFKFVTLIGFFIMFYSVLA